VNELPPILEFDPDPHGIISPTGFELSCGPQERLVVCFFQEILEERAADGRLKFVGKNHSEIGDHPVYITSVDGRDVLVMHPGVGAPLAAGLLDDMTPLGIRHVIACGGAGVLQREIAVGHPVIISSAVRDEGTSYHYMPPSREAFASPRAVQVLQQVFAEAGLPAVTGKSWTTDAFFRETPAKRDRRVQEGCLVVEMEASAFFAVAHLRGFEIGQVVYGGDLVVPEGWDAREWNTRRAPRELLLDCALKAAAGM